MTSDNRITNIIAQLGELRELLLVIEQSGDATPPILLKLAREKAEGIFNSTDQLRQPDFWEALHRQHLAGWDKEPQSVEEVIPEESQPEEEVEVEEELVVDETLAEEEIVAEEEPAEEVEGEQEDEEFPDDDEEDFLDDDEEEEYEEEYDEEDSEDEVGDECDTPETLTLDEALQRKRTQELRKALSLNDKFRFRRELFGNSDVRMNETLALIDAMTSYEEAEDYLYNDLGWDVENPEVAEFMKIVQNRFL